MHQLNTHAAYVLQPHLNRFVRRTIIEASNNDHPNESYNSGSDLNSNRLINLSTTIHHQPEPTITPTDSSCPSQLEFSKALDLPHQRADNQNPTFLNHQYKQGCRCHWSSNRLAGQPDGLICDSAPHYYHHSETGAVIRGPLKSSYQPSSGHAAVPAPLNKPSHADQDSLSILAKPVIWNGHIAHPPLKADVQHSDYMPIPVPVSTSQSLKPQPSTPHKADKTTQPSPPRLIPSLVSPVKLAQPAPPTAAHPSNSHSISTDVDPVEPARSVLPKNDEDPSVSITPSLLSASKPAQAPVNREAIGSTTTNDSLGASVTTPTLDASTSSVTPAPIPLARPLIDSGANRQMVYTSTISANGANYTGMPTSP
ncbi:hypothetical protein DFH28DRAFT_14236 [Melampsora americana]|nr:hypothetical protein DFH28DRAFT_14236 [Melampsora americana]